MNGETPRVNDSGFGRPQKFVLLAAGYAVVAVFLSVITTQLIAYRQSQTIDCFHLERAVRWDPLNADYHARLGHWHLFGDNDARAAAGSYEQATRLEPDEAQYWLALATARLQLGDSAGEFQAIRNAAAAAPTTPDVAWEAGMHLIVDGHDREALETFHNLLQSAPDDVDRVAGLCWRALHDSQRIVNEVLPRDASAYMALQRTLLAAEAYDDAEKVWKATTALHQPIPTQAGLSYVDDLLRRRKIDAASSAWTFLVEQDANLKPYREGNNLLVNSAFAQPLMNDAFDWRFPLGGPVQFAIDSNETHHGAGSLQLTFTGELLQDTHFYQLVPVSPDTEYELRATAKSAELVSATPLRFQVWDAFTGEMLGATNGVVGTTGDWVTLSGNIHTGPKSQLMRIGIAHPETVHVAGKLWIDSVEFKRTGS